MEKALEGSKLIGEEENSEHTKARAPLLARLVIATVEW
jgi:hypothetical protein